MSPFSEPSTVTIRPGVGMLGLLASMNYKPWYALSEFVDNAVASRIANTEALTAAGAAQLVVTIDLDRGLDTIIITDNAPVSQAALQGFPAGWDWKGSRNAQFRQIGNAVPPRLAQRPPPLRVRGLGRDRHARCARLARWMAVPSAT